MNIWSEASDDNIENIKSRHGNKIVYELLRHLELVLTKRKKEMTKEIFICLTNLGHKLGFKVYANVFTKKDWEILNNKERISGYEKFVNREWLYDMHWYTDVEETDYQTEDFFLAMECEWSKNKASNWNTNFKDIGYDFQKLLVCNARLRLMITRVSKTSHNIELQHYFNNAVKNYKRLQNGSKFLCVCYDMEAKKMNFMIIKYNKVKLNT